jgi:putative transposase
VYEFVRAQKATDPSFSIQRACRLLLGTKTASGYHAWAKRPPSARARSDARLSWSIRKMWLLSRKSYGSPRIHAELKDSGERVGKKRVARLMRAAGIEGAHRRKKGRTTIRDAKAAPAPDLVDRDFTADAPDRLWVADITYVRTWQGWLYLAAVIDVYSRMVVGWSMAEHMRTELVSDALAMAAHNRRPAPGLVHHSDQGTQYTSIAFGKQLREHEISASMGSVADCYDNAVAEAFWATLKTELLHQHSWPTREDARRAIFDWIETWYNPHRRHSTLGYLSPMNYEAAHKPAA